MRKALIVPAATLTFFILHACVPLQPREDAGVSPRENQLSETNRKIDEIYHKVSVIQFMVDNHQRVIRDLEKQLEELRSGRTGQIGPASLSPTAGPTAVAPAEMKRSERVTPVQTPAIEETNIALETPAAKPRKTAGPGLSAAQLYKEAHVAYKDNDFVKAQSLFNKLLEGYPKNDLTDNAIYWIGECQYARKQFQESILSFKKILEDFPEGGKVPDALLKIGYAYLALGDVVNARIYLKTVVKSYPFSPAGAKAEARLKRIKSP